jgi:FMN phosphatase YigB (HAD superfamily)
MNFEPRSEGLSVITTVLFDLDGTLLPVETHEFVDAYVHLLAQWFADRAEPARFARQLVKATQQMMANRDPAKTNRAVFAETFYAPLGLTEAREAAHLAAFYAREYPKLQAMTRTDPAARRAVRAVLDQGLSAVLATNPIFPETAIRQRMAWAGIADLPFALVTSYETSHFCKPHLEYFLEICAAIERKPRECLMVGNDADDDVAARSLGMRSYLVTDHLINHRRLPPQADYVGSLADTAALLETGDLATLRAEG